MTTATAAVPIPCDWPDCTVTRLSIGALAGHFVNRHAVSSSVAHERAAKVQREFVKADPYGLDRNGVKAAEESRPDSATDRPPRNQRADVQPSVTAPVTLADPPAPKDDRPARGEWGSGPRLTRKTAQVADETPVTCPRCPLDFPRRFALIEHLKNVHGQNTTEAMRAAKTAERAQSRAKEPAMPKDKVCKLCTRFAPEKCLRHGGNPKRGTRAGGKARAAKPPKPRTTAVSRNGASPYGTAIAALDEQIARLTVAREALAAL